MSPSSFMKTILLFGTFDGVHEGHRNLFSQAKTVAKHIVVAVAPDRVVLQLKHKKSTHTQEERMQLLKVEPLVDEVVLGDADLGTYRILDVVSPDAIGIGHDQLPLAEDLRMHMEKTGKRIPLLPMKKYDRS